MAKPSEGEIERHPIDGEGYGPGPTDALGFRRVAYEHYELSPYRWNNHRIPVYHYTVRCPFPRGSGNYLPIADHQQGQRIVVADTKVEWTPVYKPRRVIFPVVQERDDGFIEGTNQTIEQRIISVYDAYCERGFDDVRPKDAEGKVV
jgi:hypothetical protein